MQLVTVPNRRPAGSKRAKLLPIPLTCAWSIGLQEIWNCQTISCLDCLLWSSDFIYKDWDIWSVLTLPVVGGNWCRWNEKKRYCTGDKSKIPSERYIMHVIGPARLERIGTFPCTCYQLCQSLCTLYILSWRCHPLCIRFEQLYNPCPACLASLQTSPELWLCPWIAVSSTMTSYLPIFNTNTGYSKDACIHLCRPHWLVHCIP